MKSSLRHKDSRERKHKIIVQEAEAKSWTKDETKKNSVFKMVGWKV